MITPEQLADALDRIDPHDRELLSLSLRRRVPDEALARVYDCDAAEVARRRAGAIERLADELELQRGEDLGAVLKALLEPDTWSSASAAGNEFGDEPPAPASGPGPRPVLVPVEGAPAEKKRTDGDSNGAPTVVPVPNEPVLEMLAERERAVPDPPRRAVPLALVGLGLAALLGAAGLIGATQFGQGNTVLQSGDGANDDGTRHFVPERGAPLAAPFPSDPQTISCYTTAYVRRATALYREPGGRRRMTIAARTEWGSPRILGVTTQRGGWLGVQAPELRNGEVAWIPRNSARVDCVRWSLHTDLSRRVLYVRRDGHTVRKLRVAIGRPGNATPEGRFSVTDKLRVTDPDSVYGCCVLALTGHQTNLPADWPGGDRLAVHATKDVGTIGEPVSLGCLRAESRSMRWLIRTIPLGAPMFIRP